MSSSKFALFATFVFAALSFCCIGNALADVAVDVSLSGANAVKNVAGAVMGYSKAQQLIGTAEEFNGTLEGLDIEVSAQGVTNAGAGLGTYSKAIERIGVVKSQSIKADTLDVELKSAVSNSAQALGSYAEATQDIGYLQGQKVDASSLKVLTSESASITNAAKGGLAHAKAVQDIGAIKVDKSAYGNSLNVTVTGRITNSAKALGSKGEASQAVAVMTGSDVGFSRIDAKIKGKIENVAASGGGVGSAVQNVAAINSDSSFYNRIKLSEGSSGKIVNTSSAALASSRSIQKVGVISGGGISFSQLEVDLGGSIENTGGAVASAAKAEQKIGVIDVTSGAGDAITLSFDKKTTIKNASGGLGASSTAQQDIGVISGGNISRSSIAIHKAGAITNFATAAAGLGTSVQSIGVIKTKGKSSATGDHIDVSLGKVKGTGEAAVGSGKVEQDIGVLQSAGSNNNITATVGDVSGSALGVLGKGTVKEKIGVISGDKAKGTSLAISTGDITSSAAGSGSSVSIEVGVLTGTSAANQNLTIHTGSIRAEADGLNSSAEVKIGVVDSNCSVKTVDPHNITVGNIKNKNQSASMKTVIEVGHVYDDVRGPVTLAIKTGNLSINAKALGAPYNPGIQIGNIKGVHKANVNIRHGDISLDPYCAGIGGFGGCFGKALVRIGNHGISNKDKGL